MKRDRHSSDPKFVQILTRSREGTRIDDDIREIKSLANGDTPHWLNDLVKVYLTNCGTNVG